MEFCNQRVLAFRRHFNRSATSSGAKMNNRPRAGVKAHAPNPLTPSVPLNYGPPRFDRRNGQGLCFVWTGFTAAPAIVTILLT